MHRHMDDPVMGGKSVSTFGTENGMGVFDGTCAIVPFLKAPGFCKIATSGGLLQPKFEDASAYINGALHLLVRTTTPSYKGFKVAFSGKNMTKPHPAHHPGPDVPSMKADFTVPAGSEFSLVKVPFNSFSVDPCVAEASIKKRNDRFNNSSASTVIFLIIMNDKCHPNL